MKNDIADLQQQIEDISPGPPGPPGPSGIDGIDGISPNVSITREEVCVVVGWVNVEADGSINSSCGDGISVNRTAVGTYTLNGPIDSETVVLDVVEPLATRDSIAIHKTLFTGGTIHISEGDNGTAANNLRDKRWTAVWYGRKTIVTDVSVS